MTTALEAPVAAPFPMLNPRITELGKIKIGGKSAQERTSKSGGTWRAPVKLDHFVVTTMQRGPDGDLVPDTDLMAELAAEGYADADGHLRRLPIQLLSNDIPDVLAVQYLRYRGKQIEAKSDGVKVWRYLDKRNGEPLDAPEISDWKPEYADAKDPKGQPLFKLHSTLSCVIASAKARWGGVYKFRTTSRISADQLLSTLQALRGLCNEVLMGLPLNLVVTPRTVKPGGQTSTVYVVHVELRGGDMKAVMQKAQEVARFQLENRTQIQRAQTEYRRLLAAPESPEEAADAAAEFHPEEAARDVTPAKTEADPFFETTIAPEAGAACAAGSNLDETPCNPPSGNHSSGEPGTAGDSAHEDENDTSSRHSQAAGNPDSGSPPVPDDPAFKARSLLRTLLTQAKQGGLDTKRDRANWAISAGGPAEALLLDIPRAFDDAGLGDEWYPDAGSGRQCVALLERLNEQAKEHGE